MLDRAKRRWRETLAVLQDEIEAEVPVVGLEPACVPAFLDELPNLFPDDRLARRLSGNTHYSADFIMHEPDRFPLHRASDQAKVQIHCHHHAVIRTRGERELLERLGLDFEILPSGCCGMASGFGFEAETYAVSQQIAERSLFPRLRATDRDAWIIADGFSCR